MNAATETVLWRLWRQAQCIHELCNRSGDEPGDDDALWGGEGAKPDGVQGLCNGDRDRLDDGNGVALRRGERLLVRMSTMTIMVTKLCLEHHKTDE